MAKQWKALIKVQEEMNELGVELMKLQAFPSGIHPGRKKSLIPSVEDEIADVLNGLEFFVDRNGLDWDRIRKRMGMKRKRFIKWWGEPKKQRKSRIAKLKPKAKSNTSNASRDTKRDA